MDFALTEEQLKLQADVKAFASKKLVEDIVADDAQGTFPLDKWKACADFGILGASMPEEYGGTSMSPIDTMLIMEALGQGSGENGLLFSINAQMWSVQQPLATFGTPAQKDKYLGRLIRGEILGCHGMTEPGSGSDAYALSTQAKKVPGGYVIQGAKTMITNAPVADVAIVFAKTNPALGRWGISAFIVDKGTPGFKQSGTTSKMGLRTSPIGDLFFEDCFVPEGHLLGREGAGAAIFNDSMEWERACILGSHVGAMERQLESCVQYTRDRQQFGQPIGKFQSVSNRVANMRMRLEASRLMLYKMAWLKHQGMPAAESAALTKLFISEAFVESSLDAIRIHGGYGYMSEMGVERHLRDAIGGTLYSGTSDIQRKIISSFLGL